MKKLMLISIIALITSISLYSQNWPTIGGSNQRNGLSKIIGPDSILTPAWSVSSSQTVIGNSVFTFGDKFVTARAVFSPYTSKIECRSLVDGSLLWEKMVYSNSIMYAVGFSEDAVYAHDYSNGSLYALSPIDGSVKWAVSEYMFGGNSGILFACNGDPIVRGKRLDKNTGRLFGFTITSFLLVLMQDMQQAILLSTITRAQLILLKNYLHLISKQDNSNMKPASYPVMEIRNGR